MQSPSYLQGRDPGALLAAIGEWWKDLLASGRSNAALLAMGQDDVSKMAQDLGISAQDLQNFATHSIHAADEAPRMMEAAGINPAEIERHQHAVYIDMLRNCTGCDAKRRCVHDLDSGAAAAHFEEYCLNAYTLNALRAITSLGASA